MSIKVTSTPAHKKILLLHYNNDNNDNNKKKNVAVKDYSVSTSKCSSVCVMYDVIIIVKLYSAPVAASTWYTTVPTTDGRWGRLNGSFIYSVRSMSQPYTGGDNNGKC